MKLRSALDIGALWLLSWVPSVFAQEEPGQAYLAFDSTPDDTACHKACTALLASSPSTTYYSANTPLASFQSSFYTVQQSSVISACIITPPTALAAADALKIIGQHQCHFTVKSGGHAVFAGASNSEGGITIDLRLLNEIEVLEGGNVTRIGTGQRWGNVYAKLEPMGLTVLGGRNTEVGVGGFLLGGGISFLSRQHGWGCDTVLAFHLLCPNGTLSVITPTSHSALFTALRGGGSNFGIVVSFDMKTYPQGPVWAGSNIYLLHPSSITNALSLSPNPPLLIKPSLLSKAQSIAMKAIVKTVCLFPLCNTPSSISVAFSRTLIDGKDDLGASTILALTYGYDAYIAVLTAVHTSPPKRWDLSKPPPPPPGVERMAMSFEDPFEATDGFGPGVEAEPEAREVKGKKESDGGEKKATPWSWDRKNGFLPKTFQGFFDLPRVWNTNRIQNLTEAYKELTSYNVAGYRQIWGAVSFHLPPSTKDTKQPDLVALITNIWIQELATLLPHNIPDLQPSIVFQPLYPEYFAEPARRNGGNALNIELDEEKGPLILFSLAFRWASPSASTAHSQLMDGVTTRIYQRIERVLEEHSGASSSSSSSSPTDGELAHPFVYQNYASPTQDVFAGYGGTRDWARREWRAHLRAVQRSVDVDGTWRRLRRGYFVV